MMMTMKIITRRLFLLSCLLGSLTISNADPTVSTTTQPKSSTGTSTEATTTPLVTTASSPTVTVTVTLATSNLTDETTVMASTNTPIMSSTSTDMTSSTAVTSQPSSTSIQPSTSTTGKATVQTTQSIPSTSVTTGSTPSVIVSTTANITVTTTNSTATSGLNTSEIALTVIFGIVLGMVVLWLIAYSLSKRKKRMQQFSHQRLYSSADDSVDLFAPPDDTLVISGGLYDGTQMMNPTDGNVLTAQAFPVQPAPLRLEFLNDTVERTPNQASTFQTFRTQ